MFRVRVWAHVLLEISSVTVHISLVDVSINRAMCDASTTIHGYIAMIFSKGLKCLRQNRIRAEKEDTVAILLTLDSHDKRYKYASLFARRRQESHASISGRNVSTLWVRHELEVEENSSVLTTANTLHELLLGFTWKREVSLRLYRQMERITCSVLENPGSPSRETIYRTFLTNLSKLPAAFAEENLEVFPWNCTGSTRSWCIVSNLMSTSW